MINCLQIEQLILPPRFIFDTLTLTARFQTLQTQLTRLSFNLTEAHTSRRLPLKLQLKVPIALSHLTLVLEVSIINMRIEPVEMKVQLGSSRKLQYVFQTDMGRVAVDLSMGQQICLPTLSKRQGRAGDSVKGSQSEAEGSQFRTQKQSQKQRSWSKGRGEKDAETVPGSVKTIQKRTLSLQRLGQSVPKE